MQIVKITKKTIDEAVAILKRGGAVVYPTETAYALGCDFTNQEAIAKIFKIKNRPKEKALPVICQTKKQVEQFFILPPFGWKLWLKYWPKPISIIIKTREHKNKKTKPREIPVRISSHKVVRDLARKLDRPVISTSANISGSDTLYSAEEIAEIFADKKYQPDLILDAGKLPKRQPSTIVKIDNNKIEVLRQGEVRI